MKKYKSLYQLLVENDAGRGGGLLGNVGGATGQFAAVHFLNAFFEGTYEFTEVSTAATSSTGDDCVLEVRTAGRRGRSLGNIFIELKDGGGEFYQQSNRNAQRHLDEKLGYVYRRGSKTKGTTGEHYVMVFPGGKNYQECYLFQGGRSGSPLAPTAAIWGEAIPEMPVSCLGALTDKNSKPIRLGQIKSSGATLTVEEGDVSNIQITKDAVVRLNGDGWRERNRNQLADLIGVNASLIKEAQEHFDAHGNSALPSMWHRGESRWYPYIAKLYDNPNRRTGIRQAVVDAYKEDLWPKAQANMRKKAFVKHTIGTITNAGADEQAAEDAGKRLESELDGAALNDENAENVIEMTNDGASEGAVDVSMDEAIEHMAAIRAKFKSVTVQQNDAIAYLAKENKISWNTFSNAFMDGAMPRIHPKRIGQIHAFLRWIFGLPDNYVFTDKDMGAFKKLGDMHVRRGKDFAAPVCKWWIEEVLGARLADVQARGRLKGYAWLKSQRADLAAITKALPELRRIVKKQRKKGPFMAMMEGKRKYSLKNRLLD